MAVNPGDGGTTMDTDRGNMPIAIMIAAMALSLAIVMLFVPVIPQSQSYHAFADQRTLLGIPNFWNVISNVPFVVIGAIGWLRYRDDPATFVLFTGICLTGFGSAYYHWNPTDDTLFWDRLPMTLGFMAILAGIAAERIDARAGALLLWPLLGFGLFSLLWWRWHDDLRLYAWAQFFPILALPVLFWLFPAKYTNAIYWLIAAACYTVAKAFEFSDAAIYSVGEMLSGHTLKHLAAAVACWAILRYFQTRKAL
jgi:hypothetical protein